MRTQSQFPKAMRHKKINQCRNGMKYIGNAENPRAVYQLGIFATNLPPPFATSSVTKVEKVGPSLECERFKILVKSSSFPMPQQHSRKLLASEFSKSGYLTVGPLSMRISEGRMNKKTVSDG